MAFAVATTFWFFNSLNKNYTTSLEYPVRFIYNQDSLVSVRVLPASIDLDVSGGGWNLLRTEALFNPKPLEIALENPVGIPYLSWLQMLPSIREQLSDLSVNQVLQDTLRIQIEPILSKKVRLWVDSTKIKLEDDFRLVSAVSLPIDSITLVGPKSFIDTLKSTFELQLLEGGVDENFDENVLVVIPKPQLIHSIPPAVQATFEVDRFDELQIEVPIEIINFPTDSSYYLAESNVILHFTVQRSLQKDYVKTDFGIFADFYMMNTEDSTTSVLLLHFPEEVVNVRIRQTKIRVLSNE